MLNFLIAIVFLGCIALVAPCFFGKSKTETCVESPVWIENRAELIDSKIVRDTQSNEDLKVLTRVDSHGEVFAIDLLTLNNHAYECIRASDEFDARRFSKVI
ncbi:MAG: hypothetical protein RR738_04735 [Anaerorhabdus sp.]|uniref:hypothetical protein n=1 Tax=Anaerorhabdus sp. TaxID=1872524 RepID=UPI002FC8B3F9